MRTGREQNSWPPNTTVRQSRSRLAAAKHSMLITCDELRGLCFLALFDKSGGFLYEYRFVPRSEGL